MIWRMTAGNHKVHRDTQRGFTIVELLIATSVMSVILLVVSIMMVNVGKLYQKGIVSSRIQNNARSITDELAQRIQLSNAADFSQSPPSVGQLQSYCIGTYRYSFVTNKQLGTDSAHVLWRDVIPTGSCPNMPAGSIDTSTPGNGTGTNGQELLIDGASLQNLSITPSGPGGGAFQITATEAYGTTDLLGNAGTPNVYCLGQAGGQFCSTTTISTNVVPRLTGGN